MLTPDQVDDFVTLTLSHFKRKKWTDISLEHQHYIASGLITDKAITERGGKDISFRLKTKNTGTARNTGLFAQDSAKVEDLAAEASVPWTKQTVNWSYDQDEELFQSDPETIISEMKMREHGSQSEMAELNEVNLWKSPVNAADKRPMGIPFWIQKDPNTTPDGGFGGGNPAGFPGGAANVDSANFPRWRNWAAGYDHVTSNDLVAKIKRALAFTHFVAPVPHPELGFGSAMHCIYTTYRVQERMERLAESRNDNLGNDVARYLNQVVVGGVPIKWVPHLEANDTSDPLYGINWRVFRPFVKRGANMRRSKPLPAPGATQHNVKTIHYDTWMNYICYNRRMLWVISKR